MTSKEALEKVKNYHYADRYVFQYTEEYNIIKQDLDRLEKLEKTIELLKARVKMLETHHEPRSHYYHLFIGGRVVLLSREEYKLLKEVLENETKIK